MKTASMTATPADGVSAMPAPVADDDVPLVVLELPPLLVPFDDTVLSEPPSTVTPGRLAVALAARAVYAARLRDAFLATLESGDRC